MSALGGVLNFGNTPATVDLYQLSDLGIALEARGPDGGRDIVVGNIGMSYRAYHTTPESCFERQPHVSPEGHILVWNGRLDNREELIRKTRSQLRVLSSSVTDLDIVMAAYLRWEDDCFVRLIGDFCLALWDARLNLLYLVRDLAGTRTLFFNFTADKVIWSTELAPLAKVRNAPLEIDEEYLAGFLTRGPEPGLTPYKNVRALKPAHLIAITQDGMFRERRFWGLDPNKEIVYKNDQDYEEHFLNEFQSGLRGRLRSHLPVFAELSGGLDSSSIVCATDRIIASGKAQTPKLETISYIYDESPTADESKFIRYVEGQRGRANHDLRESEYRILAPLRDRTPIFAPNGLHGFAEYYRGLCETMHEGGARVLLSGEGGDEILGSSDDPAPELSDLLLQTKFIELHRRLQLWSQTFKRPYLWLLWQHTIVPTLPRKLRAICNGGSLLQVPYWFNPTFAKATDLRARMLGAGDIYGFRLPSGRDQSIGFISVVNHIVEGARRDLTEVETTYPYMHRPLVEFMQAIPFEQRVRPGQTRSLTRRALGSYLPEQIARRRGKGNPHEALCRAVDREWPRLQMLFADSRAEKSGYIDSRALLDVFSQARYGSKTPFVALMNTLSLELWLRALEALQGHRVAAVNTAKISPTSSTDSRAASLDVA